MKIFSLSLFCVALIFTLSSSAAYADTFDFSFSGSGYSGSGTITAAPDPAYSADNGIYLISAITGTTNGVSIAGLIPVQTYPIVSACNSNNNDLYVPEVATIGNNLPGYLDIYGLSYVLADGTDINLWFGVLYGLSTDPGNTDIYYLLTGGTDPSDSHALDNFILTQSDAATSEPTSLLLLGTGAVGLFFIMHRRRIA